MKLLDGVTEDTTGAWMELPLVGQEMHGEYGIFVASDDLGGGTVTIQITPDDGTVAAFIARNIVNDQLVFTIPDYTVMKLRGSVRIRAVLSSSTNPQPVTVILN